jgi:molecular chaperone HscA
MALLQIQEPGQGKDEQDSNELIIGIDLGTTNSLVGVVDDGVVEILKDDKNCDIIPSIVCYDNDGNVLSVGESCKSAAEIHSIKRLMGKNFNDVKNEDLGFKVVDDKGVLRVVVGSRKVRPEEVSSEILKYLKTIAEKKLNTQIHKAVITVPAYFDEAAKNATKLAANLANLEVVRLVNEPTAAALAYGLENSSQGIYCIYDLGGGTFDVSILKMQQGVFKVLGVAGDNHLGGDDFDNAIIEKFPQLTRLEARKIKELLSKNASVDVNGLKFLAQEFENLILEKINKTIKLTNDLIEDLNLEASQIKGVVLVGGSTKIPAIRGKLAEIFTQEKILINNDCDRVVAIGAAWQAYNLSSKSDNLLLDVNPLSLGIEMMGGIVEKIIQRNSTIPSSYAKEFTTYANNQTGMKFHIVQGERELAADCRSLANFEIKGIPALPAGMARVLVTFRLDADGLLTVSAEEKHTKTKQEIEIKPSYHLNENEVKNMLLNSLENSKKDIEKRLLIEAATEALQDVAIIEDDLKKPQLFKDEKEKELIIKKLQILKKAIEEKKSRDDIISSQQDLSKVSQDLVLRKVNEVLQEKISGKKVDEFI